MNTKYDPSYQHYKRDYKDSLYNFVLILLAAGFVGVMSHEVISVNLWNHALPNPLFWGGLITGGILVKALWYWTEVRRRGDLWREERDVLWSHWVDR